MNLLGDAGNVGPELIQCGVQASGQFCTVQGPPPALHTWVTVRIKGTPPSQGAFSSLLQGHWKATNPATPP